MTPELKIACEVVFQEHKAATQPIKWNREAFRGRISIGLSAMAKETLVSKNIIFSPVKSKKIITLLNPVVVAAANFEEAEQMIKNKVPAAAGITIDKPAYIADPVSGFNNATGKYSHSWLAIAGVSEAQPVEIKWYMKPLFYFVVWPLCAAAAGAGIAFLIRLSYSEIFLNMK
jgi:hypothetical protein